MVFWITVIRNLRSVALEFEPLILATNLGNLHVYSFRAQSVIVTLKEAKEADAEVLLGGIEKDGFALLRPHIIPTGVETKK